MIHWFQHALQYIVEIVPRNPDQHTFEGLPKRWIVERAFGWFNRQRQLSKDYDVYAETTDKDPAPPRPNPERRRVCEIGVGDILTVHDGAVGVVTGSARA